MSTKKIHRLVNKIWHVESYCEDPNRYVIADQFGNYHHAGDYETREEADAVARQLTRPTIRVELSAILSR